MGLTGFITFGGTHKGGRTIARTRVESLHAITAQAFLDLVAYDADITSAVVLFLYFHDPSLQGSGGT
jgi:hypothetical protein